MRYSRAVVYSISSHPIHLLLLLCLGNSFPLQTISPIPLTPSPLPSLPHSPLHPCPPSLSLPSPPNTPSGLRSIPPIPIKPPPSRQPSISSIAPSQRHGCDATGAYHSYRSCCLTPTLPAGLRIILHVHCMVLAYIGWLRLRCTSEMQCRLQMALDWFGGVASLVLPVWGPLCGGCWGGMRCCGMVRVVWCGVGVLCLDCRVWVLCCGCGYGLQRG